MELVVIKSGFKYDFNIREIILLSLESMIKNTNTFITEVERIVYELDCPYVDAVIRWCEQNNVEVELAAEMIKKNSPLKGKIQTEAEDLNILKKSAGRLPI